MALHPKSRRSWERREGSPACRGREQIKELYPKDPNESVGKQNSTGLVESEMQKEINDSQARPLTYLRSQTIPYKTQKEGPIRKRRTMRDLTLVRFFFA